MFLRKEMFIYVFLMTQIFGSAINIEDARTVALELLNRRNIENKDSYSINNYYIRESN